MKKRIPVLVVYWILFYGAWAAFELIFKDMLYAAVSSELFRELIRSGIIKNLVWTLPAVLLIRHYEKDIAVPLREMLTPKKELLRYIPLYLLVAAYVLMMAYKAHGRIGIVDTFNEGKIVVVLFVGITEEMVFRGWLLNRTIRSTEESPAVWTAVAVNAVLFLTIHFPIWLNSGVFYANFANLGFAVILVLSSLFSWCFIRSRNILVPITLHAFYDLLVFMLI